MKIVKGCVIKAGMSGVSGIYYPEEVLREAVRRFREAAKETPVFGELGTLGSFGRSIGSSTNLSNISHVVTDLEFTENGEVVATISTMKTPRGVLLEDMLQDSVDDNNVNENLSLTPIMEGSLEDNRATRVRIVRVDVIDKTDTQ